MADVLSTSFRLVTEMSESEGGFRDWLAALTSQGEQRSRSRWWIPSERLMLSLEPPFSPQGALPKIIALAHDGTGERWTVQINLPTTPGTVNGLSGIAFDTSNRRWLLRQGFLRPNRDSDEVKGEDFRLGSGLTPVQVDVPSGNREWYRVALLDAEIPGICRDTSRFVARCAEARLRFGFQKEHLNSADTAVIQQLFSSPETGGTYIIPPKPATEAVTVDKVQGEVWEGINAELAKVGRTLEKPRHAIGYEVDGVIAGPSGSVLIEIKSDVSAASIYTGVGQLMVYRKLLPSLANHSAILLLPGRPSQPLTEAVQQLGIAIEVYERHTAEAGDLKLSQRFRELCGLP